MQNITILGSTGSIGRNALDILSRYPDRWRVFALTANRQADTLFEQCQQFKPKYAVMVDPAAANELKDKLQSLHLKTQVLSGAEALCDVSKAPEVDTVLAGIVGGAGLPSSMAAAKTGKRILLANKESLVMAGQLFMDAVNESGAVLLPVDSEHNAIFQSMPNDYVCGQQAAGVKNIVLTSSGGPFRETPVSELSQMTPNQACAHPNWAMGRKISVDSATMVNKGLEMIEAKWLFNLAPEAIDVVLHPQSIVHSCVHYVDGSYLAQMGPPDMRVPLAHCLAYPDRIDSGVEPLDLLAAGQLDFQAVDLEKYPGFALAKSVLSASPSASVVYNAANEVAVDAFLEGSIRFTDIANHINKALEHFPKVSIQNLDDIIALDADVRAFSFV